MISRCGLMQKRDDLTMEQFANHWENVHGPLVASTAKGLKHYEQHLVVDNQHRHPLGAGPIVIDGYSELQFDSYADMVEGMNNEHKGEYAEDCLKFAKPCTEILVFAKKVCTEVPKYLRGKELITRVSFLGRKEGVTNEQFQREWWYIHDMLVKSMPGYVGFNQNLVIDRIVDGKSVPYEQLPVEGMVEFFFEDMDAFNECYSSAEFQRCVKHGGEFIGLINTYLTKTTVIK